MSHRIETELKSRPKGRSPVWVVRVLDGEKVVFSSERIAVRFKDEAAARTLGLAAQAALAGSYSKLRRKAEWNGDLSDDCSSRIGQWSAHVEHLEGPRNGGAWYFSVNDDVFHSVAAGVVPKSGGAARQLAELVAAAADNGFRGPT